MQDLNLAVVGNCVVAALIDRRARIVWWCLPRLDGDPVFSNLLEGDLERGFADVALDRQAESTQSYVGNTAIVSTLLQNADGGSVRVTDFMPRFKRFDRIYRPAMLVRRIEPVTGLCKLRIRIRPAGDHGGAAPVRMLGSNHLRYIGPEISLRLTTDAPLAYIAGESPFVLTQPVTLILGPDEMLEANVAQFGRESLERTRDYWLEWSRYLAVPFEWQDAVIRAAITLKLCSFEETGAIVAALTSSVPEAPATARNWDYRHCWLRDAFFVVHALNRLGATRTMEDYLGYITTVTALQPEADLKPVYGIVPDLALDERIVPSLAGYRGMGPVRVGNQAALQKQNDVYGSIVLAVAQAFFDRRLPQMGDVALFERLERLGERAEQVAFEPDAGLWEYRGRARIHVHSAAMCWAACARLAKIARHLGLEDRAASWHRRAEALRRAILEQAWNPQRQSFVADFGGTELDASLLQLQEIGFVAAADPRFHATVDAIGRELRRGTHLLRYAGEDDFGLPESGFTICSFWYVDALAAIGRGEEARALLIELMGRRNHVGLLSEDVHPVTGELWGNFPQTYSMAGLVVSAMRLSKSWEEAFWRGS
ncbi:MAG: glycoside hydrolase family 15 protein [Alphaproteobacteria bacterium]|nr:glycoside hydrolase family 15 protein [Alphaproteobacteria bacterium]